MWLEHFYMLKEGEAEERKKSTPRLKPLAAQTNATFYHVRRDNSKQMLLFIMWRGDKIHWPTLAKAGVEREIILLEFGFSNGGILIVSYV